MQGWGFEFIRAVKHAVSVLTEIWSRGVSAASSAYSSGRGKLSRRGPLYPFPHLVGGDGSILSGIASRASPMLSSPRKALRWVVASARALARALALDCSLEDHLTETG
eukprot:scaffold3111_cov138-Isochrysis_galbana.AAC.1